jgi:3-deoxy-7-phosphoheptulonate synthase
MTQALVPTDWHPASWQSRHAAQQPTYRDRGHLETVLAQLGNLPPIVTTWEVENLKGQLAKAQRGDAFLLQGGDCAESFDECTSDNVVRKLKILLQMSLVMLVGLKKPIIRVGRMAGQYAKPRSADYETKNGVSLQSYRGDTINRPGFTAADREPDPDSPRARRRGSGRTRHDAAPHPRGRRQPRRSSGGAGPRGLSASSSFPHRSGRGSQRARRART